MSASCNRKEQKAAQSPVTLLKGLLFLNFYLRLLNLTRNERRVLLEQRQMEFVVEMTELQKFPKRPQALIAPMTAFD